LFTALHIDHVEVFVRDLDAAVEWYGRVLGLQEVGRWNPEPIMIGVGGTKVALFRGDGAAARGASNGWHRVAWLTDEAGFRAAQAHLTSHGVAFRGPIDHQTSNSIYFADPDGNLLEITYYL
jgi:catechol-2,3-dioxygenase